jgi:hypothetical protein
MFLHPARCEKLVRITIASGFEKKWRYHSWMFPARSSIAASVAMRNTTCVFTEAIRHRLQRSRVKPPRFGYKTPVPNRPRGHHRRVAPTAQMGASQ